MKSPFLPRIITLFIFGISINLNSQCPSGNVELNSQSQVDQFIVDYPNCTKISGYLKLKANDIDCLFGACSTDIVDLTPFTNIDTILGQFLIDEATNISSLLGINNLEYCEKFQILNCDNLTLISPTLSLNQTDDLLLDQNDQLLSLSGFSNLNEINNFLRIRDNTSLTSCDIQAVCEFLDIGGTTLISNNDTHCNSESEIISECNNLTVPDCVNIIFPSDNHSNLFINLLTQWETSLTASGYKMSIGTTSGGTDLLDNFDVGNITEYMPPSLPWDTDIFLKVIPYNAQGEASACDEISFTTAEPDTCFDANTFFFSQNDLDIFDQNYSSCNVIEGSVKISGNDIVGVGALDNITQIDGNLIIEDNTALTSLFGLRNVNQIGGSIIIEFNDSEFDITHFNQLDSLGGQFKVWTNEAIKEISNFNRLSKVNKEFFYFLVINNASLESVGGFNAVNEFTSLNIQDNPSLGTLDDFDNLQKVSDFFRIQNNDLLSNINQFPVLDTIDSVIQIYANNKISDVSFPSLTHISGGLDIWSNFELETVNFPQLIQVDSFVRISGNDIILEANLNSLSYIKDYLELTEFRESGSDFSFASLDSIGGHLYFVLNHGINNLDGFSNLKKIGDYLAISSNVGLASLNGLSNLDFSMLNSTDSNFEDLRIRNNPLMNQCDLLSFCNFLDDNNKTYLIENNNLKCSEDHVIKNHCACKYGYSNERILDGPIDIDSTYVTNLKIESNQTIESNIIINYDALESILLLPGFELKQNSEFNIMIMGCDN